MKTSYFKSFLLLALTSAISGNSFAAGPGASGWGVGGLVGFGNIASSIANSTQNNGVNFGAEVNYHFDPSFDAGLSWTMLPYSINNVSGFTFSSYALSFNYHFAETLNPLYAGVELGLAGFGYAATTNIPAATYFLVGVRAGYDLQITNELTVGPQLRFDIVPMGAQGQTPSYTVNNFQALAKIAYWF